MTNAETDPNEVRLRSVDAVTLTPLVQKLPNRDRVSVTDWQYTPIHGGTGGGQGGNAIYRFTGNALDQGETYPWSLILKVVRARPGESPDSTHYWKREAELYRSGLVDNLPGRFHAARGLDVVEYADESVWIWQEEVSEAVGDPWQMEHYRLTARHLGYFNGAHLKRAELPAHDWLSTGWLRKITESAEEYFEQIVEMLRTLAQRGQSPPDSEEHFSRMWEDRHRLLDALDRLPQTFCHQDPVRQNLFLKRGDDGELETVAIDWAFVGIGPIGMEIAVALIISLIFLLVDAAEAEELSEELYGGYLEGLRESGFAGDERLVRLGFVASSVCKYYEMLMLNAIFGLSDPARTAEWEAGGQSKDEILAAYAEIFKFVVKLAHEARSLMDELGY